MKDAPQAAPEDPDAGIDPGQRMAPDTLVAKASTVDSDFRGGSRAGHQLLESFLSQRGMHYQKEMSSPVTAWNSCSRLQPLFHLWRRFHPPGAPRCAGSPRGD